MVRTINFNSEFQLLNNKAIVTIPRKDNFYYEQFERILITNNIFYNDVVDIFLIKDFNKEPSTYK